VRNIISFVLILFCMLSASAAKAWTIDFVVGDVNVEMPDGETHAAAGGEVLPVGSIIVTGQGAKAILQDGASEISMASETRFKIETAPVLSKKKLGLLQVLQGKIRAKFVHPENQPRYPYEVKMRTAVAGVRGTEFFVIVTPTSETVCTTTGLVHVTSLANPTETWDVAAGKTAVKEDGKSLALRDSDRTEVAKWKSETKKESAVEKVNPAEKSRSSKKPIHR